ncbi:class I tRNA ligase family protein [bacterium]|nr:class I tRNA ligase family protein [bacterium]
MNFLKCCIIFSKNPVVLEITFGVNNVTNNLSNWYFDIIKDVLYCDSLKSKRRKQTQTTLYLILKNYLIVLAPILPHITEELYQIANAQFN